MNDVFHGCVSNPPKASSTHNFLLDENNGMQMVSKLLRKALQSQAGEEKVPENPIEFFAGRE